MLAGLSYYNSNQQDPNISKHGAEADSEAEDFEVQASDYVILAARNEDAVSHIEVNLCYPMSHVQRALFEALEHVMIESQSECSRAAS